MMNEPEELLDSDIVSALSALMNEMTLREQAYYLTAACDERLLLRVLIGNKTQDKLRKIIGAALGIEDYRRVAKACTDLLANKSLELSKGAGNRGWYHKSK